MADALFSDPRLALLYDHFDGARDDLDNYERILRELAAQAVLDVGCGTGSLACRLARAGLDVVAVDPARASLDVACSKRGADRVTWIHGDATVLPPLHVDVAVMTGNVAQVFLTDEDFSSTLRGIHDALRPGGHLVFESRRPEYRAWMQWAQASAETADVGGVGTVTLRRVVTAIELPLVSFRQTYTFPDGTQVVSDTTLRFQTCDALMRHLGDAGFTVLEVTDAPDRPGREFVFVAQKQT